MQSNKARLTHGLDKSYRLLLLIGMLPRVQAARSLIIVSSLYSIIRHNLLVSVGDSSGRSIKGVQPQSGQGSMISGFGLISPAASGSRSS